MKTLYEVEPYLRTACKMHKSTVFVKGAKVQSLTIYSLAFKYCYILNFLYQYLIFFTNAFQKDCFVCHIHNFNVIQVGIQELCKNVLTFTYIIFFVVVYDLKWKY